MYLFEASEVGLVQSCAWMRNVYSFRLLQSKKWTFLGPSSSLLERSMSLRLTSMTASPVVLSLMSMVNGKSSLFGLNTWYEQIPSILLKFLFLNLINLYFIVWRQSITYCVYVFYLQVRLEINENISLADRSYIAQRLVFDLQYWCHWA